MADLDKILSSAPFASSTTKLANANIILSEFESAGLPLSWGLAAVVNAYAESKLDASAVGDKGKSIGLFQLHESGGGYGMSASERKDPHKNVRRIISELKAAKNRTKGVDLSQGGKTITFPNSLASAYDSGKTLAEIAGLFSVFVERPYDLLGEQRARAQLTQTLFPGVAAMPAYLLDRASSPLVVAKQVVTGKAHPAVYVVGGLCIVGMALAWRYTSSRSVL